MELALSLFWFIFAMVFLIGMGHTLINRQQALVGARFAAFYRTDTGREATAAMITSSIKSPEVWNLRPAYTADGGGVRDGLGGGGLGGILNSVMDRIDQFGGDGSLTYRTETRPTKGLLPRMFTLESSARYAIANDPWSCEKGGSYLDMLTSQLPLPGEMPLALSCCTTYPKR
jgi:hypothetical protein